MAKPELRYITIARLADNKNALGQCRVISVAATEGKNPQFGKDDIPWQLFSRDAEVWRKGELAKPPVFQGFLGNVLPTPDPALNELFQSLEAYRESLPTGNIITTMSDNIANASESSWSGTLAGIGNDGFPAVGRLRLGYRKSMAHWTQKGGEYFLLPAFADQIMSGASAESATLFNDQHRADIARLLGHPPSSPAIRFKALAEIRKALSNDLVFEITDWASSTAITATIPQSLGDSLFQQLNNIVSGQVEFDLDLVRSILTGDAQKAVPLMKSLDPKLDYQRAARLLLAEALSGFVPSPSYWAFYGYEDSAESRLRFDAKPSRDSGVHLWVELLDWKRRQTFFDISGGIAHFEDEHLKAPGAADWRADLTLSAGEVFEVTGFLAEIVDATPSLPEYKHVKSLYSELLDRHLLNTVSLYPGMKPRRALGSPDDENDFIPTNLTEELIQIWVRIQGKEYTASELHRLALQFESSKFLSLKPKRRLEIFKEAAEVVGANLYTSAMDVLFYDEDIEKNWESPIFFQVIEELAGLFGDEEILYLFWVKAWSEIMGISAPGSLLKDNGEELFQALEKHSGGISVMFKRAAAGKDWNLLLQKIRDNERTLITGTHPSDFDPRSQAFVDILENLITSPLPAPYKRTIGDDLNLDPSKLKQQLREWADANLGPNDPRRRHADWVSFENFQLDLRFEMALPEKGVNLISIAVLSNVLYLRIFDAGGKILIDKDENNLIASEGLKALFSANAAPDVSQWSEAQIKNVMNQVALAQGFLDNRHVGLTPAPTPLRFARPDLASDITRDEDTIDGDKNFADTRGALVFCKRTPNQEFLSGDKTSLWRSINLGFSTWISGSNGKPAERKILAKLTPVPIGVTANMKLPNRIEAFDGDPIGVRLLRNNDYDHIESQEKPQTPSSPPLIEYWQLGKDDDKFEWFEESEWNDQWYLTPYLGYGWYYHFIQAPVYQDGVIPLDLLQPGKPIDGAEGLPLKPVEDVSLFIDTFLKQNTVDAYVQRRRCERTVGVGPLRLNVDEKGTIKDKIFPRYPENVKPLSGMIASRLKVRAENGMRTNGSMHPDLDLEALPPVILYEKDKNNTDNELVTDKITFRVRPPVAGLEDWARWRRRKDSGEDVLQREIEIADARVAARKLQIKAEESNKAAAKPGKTVAVDAVDDLAVLGYIMVAERLYSSGKGLAGIGNRAVFTSEIVHEEGFRPSEGIPHNREYENDLPLRRISSKSIDVSYIDQVLTDDQIQKDLNNLRLHVPIGEVWRVTVFPCVKIDDANQFFSPLAHRSIFEGRPEIQHPKGWKVAVASGESFLVESAPALSHASMPTPDAIYKSLQYAVEDSPDGKREIVIKVNPQLAFPTGASQKEVNQFFAQWANVADLRSAIQPWRWNGLPSWAWPCKGSKSGHPGHWLAHPRDQDDPGYVEAEFRAYATRLDQDAELLSGGLNWLRDEQHDSNAAVVLGNKGIPVTAVPRFVKARLMVSPRYWGLPFYSQNESLRDIEGFPEAHNYSAFHRWKDCLVLPPKASELEPPRVKMVVPMLKGLDEQRPGFLAVTDQPPPSPFHTLTAHLKRVSVKIPGNDDSDEDIVLESIQAGPDPVFHPGSPSGSNPTWTDLLLSKNPWMVGRSIGLTRESEAQTPLFGECVFAFERLPEAFDHAENEDWFMELNFRWERSLGSSKHSDAFLISSEQERKKKWNQEWAECDSDRGQESGYWQVRVLSEFEKIRNLSDGMEVDLSQLRCFENDSGIQFFRIDSGTGKNIPIHPAPVTSDDRYALLFLTFSETPDFFSKEPSLTPNALYVIGPKESNEVHRFSHQNPNEKKRAVQGRMLLVLVSPAADLGESNASSRLLNKIPENSSFETIQQLFFPALGESHLDRLNMGEEKDAMKEDALAMVYRSSIISIPVF